MKKLWLLVGLLLSCQASVVPVDPTMYEGPLRRFRNDGRDRLGGDDPLFQFLPISGAGAPAASDLCDAVTTDDKAGNWWCLNGSGTSTDADGGVVLSAVGAPTTQTRPLCSNGLTCADATAQRTDGVDDAYASGNVASNAGGDVSVCWLGMHDSMANYRSMVSHADNTANDNAYSFYTDATGAATVVVYKTNASSTSVTTAASAITARARHLVCFTYDYVTDGTSVLRTYVDGAESGTASTTAVGPMQTASGTTEAVAYRPWSGSNLWLAGATFGAFKTEKVLSAADITRLSNAVHGTLTGSRAEAVTFTRTSAQTCDNGSGSVTVLPSGRPCVAQGGYLSEGSATNLLLRSEEFGTTWSTVGSAIGATISENFATSPDGTSTADRLEIPAVTGGGRETLTQSITAAAGSTTLSVWLKGTSGSGSVYLSAWVAATGASCFKTLCTYNSSTWTRCTATGTMTAALWTVALGTWRAVVDCNHDETAASDVLAWGAQSETGAIATSYIRTEGSTATRNASTAYVVNPLGNSDNTWCASATLVPPTGPATWVAMRPTVAMALWAFDQPAASSNMHRAWYDTDDFYNNKWFSLSHDNAGDGYWQPPSATDSYGSLRVGICNASGTVTNYRAGALVANGTGGGTGTRTWTTAPSRFYLGNSATGGTAVNGFVSNACIDRRNPGPCR